ncbi:MAG TPA: hypothetical protein VEU29_05895 [Actinomycetota bacterium]|nr:hypothetical protein [Actinomycetota bacterium]
MRKLPLLLAAVSLALLPSAQAAVGGPDALPSLQPLGAAEAPVFAAGGTPLSNGIFFPGTAACVGTDCQGVPYEVAKGSDLRFYNLDTAVVANNHRIVSKDTNKRGRPLFQSETIGGPASTLVKTSHLKPGVYGYYCSVHYGMDGLLEITS